MKKLMCVVLVAAFVAGCSSSSSVLKREHFEKAEQGYVTILRSDNHGAVESAIFAIVDNQLHYPKQNTAVLQRELSRLTVEGATPAIRTKAELAHQFLKQNDAEMTAQVVADYIDPEKLFGVISKTLNNEALLANE